MGKSWLKKAAGIVFTDGKSILLLKRAEGNHQGTWGLPGGKSNEGETDIGNAVRETQEETGLKTIPGERFDSLIHKNGLKKYTAFFYKVSRPFDIKLNHEHSNYDWVDFEDLKNLSLHPKLKERISDYLRKIRKKIANFKEWKSLKDVETYFG